MLPDEDFKDTTGVAQILLVVVALVAFPLLPMLTGWFAMLS